MIGGNPLAELMEVGQQSEYESNSSDPKGVGPKKSFEERSRDYQIELRAKHMTTAQLDASIEFYESDMGASIIESGARITQEFKKTFHKRMGSPQPTEGEPGWVVWRPNLKHEEDDT